MLIIKAGKVLANPKRSLLAVALQFTLAKPAFNCPIPGMRYAAQARAYTTAADGQLSAADLAVINSINPSGIDVYPPLVPQFLEIGTRCRIYHCLQSIFFPKDH